MFVAQGKYISECADESNKGFFFGYFWAWFMLSQIIGNFIAAMVLGKLTQSAYFISMTAITTLASMIFVFMKKPISHNLGAVPSN